MDASVIIPTHNRKELVQLAVGALMRQDYPPDRYEVIVSCDRCTDGTAGALKAEFGDRVRVATAEAPGQCGALNTGLKLARGHLVIAIDDEMQARSGFVAAHVSAHRQHAGEKAVVTGYSKVVLDETATPYLRLMAHRYEAYFARLADPARVTSPNDLCGSNFSAPLDAVLQAGGFNESYFFQRNDFELAVRLIRRGFRVYYCPEARTDHRLAVSAESILDRTAARAAADCRLAREYPWCLPHLPFFRVLSDASVRRRWQVLWRLAQPAAAVFHCARRFFPRNPRLVDLEYAARYCIGLRQETGSWRAFEQLAGAS